MANLNCQVEIVHDKELFAGQSFYLNCESGEALPNINSKSAELRVDEAQKDTIKLVQLSQKSERLVQLKVVSFEAGQHKVENALVVDAENSIIISPFQFTVSSVLDPKNPPKGPNGPLGVELSWPAIYFIGILIFIILCLIPIVYKLLLFRKRRKLMTAVRNQQIGLNPAQNYFKTVRKIMRRIATESTQVEPQFSNVMAELMDSWLLFLAAKTSVPTAGWGYRRFKKELSKKISAEDLKLIRNSWKELQFWSGASVQSKKMTGSQAESVLKSASNVVDRIDSYDF